MPLMSDRATLVDRATAATGLSDFGDPWIFENLDHLLPALDAEAELTEAGVAGAEAMVVSGLSNRLRHVDLVKRNPQILDERIEVAAVVVGLPRTGSTMLHRMLTSAPGMTGVKWWEAQNYAPLGDERPDDAAPRRAAAEAYLAYMLEHAPDLMSIHPMSIDQSDEELIVLGQLFSSTMIEGMYHVPSYAQWLVEHSRTRCYADLHQILQSLQWQDPRRKGAKWVLKTPGHLMALDAVLDTFPGARIVMTHRDPVQTVPSYCSMMKTLYHMGSTVSQERIGAFWEKRLAQLLDMFMEVRRAQGSDRFVDVRYTDLTARPLEEGARVLEAAGIAVDETTVAGMADWIEANRREERAPHRYDLADFNLTKEQVEKDFATYRSAFLGEAITG